MAVSVAHNRQNMCKRATIFHQMNPAAQIIQKSICQHADNACLFKLLFRRKNYCCDFAFHAISLFSWQRKIMVFTPYETPKVNLMNLMKWICMYSVCNRKYKNSLYVFIAHWLWNCVLLNYNSMKLFFFNNLTREHI